MLEFVEKLYGRSIWECEPYYIVKATLQLSTETTGNKNKEVVVGAIQASWIWRRGKKREKWRQIYIEETMYFVRS